jgi:hypothetical protein
MITHNPPTFQVGIVHRLASKILPDLEVDVNENCARRVDLIYWGGGGVINLYWDVGFKEVGLVGWLVGWLYVGGLVGWLAGWLADEVDEVRRYHEAAYGVPQ